MAARSRTTNIHALVVTGLALVMLAVWLSGGQPEQQANAAAEAPAEAPPVEAKPFVAPTPTPPPPALPPSPERLRYEVGPGDNLSSIFSALGLSQQDLYAVRHSGPLGKEMASIHPGHAFEFEPNAEGDLLYLAYVPGPLETLEFRRVGDSFEGTRLRAKVETVVASAHGTIESSLFLACKQAGLPEHGGAPAVSDVFAEKLAEIFQWDIDFILDVRANDEFHVLYEQRLVAGEFVELGNILAAEFVNQGRSHRAALYEENGARSYYGPDGSSMRKTFLRAPLKFNRVSSRFNLRRRHPLWNSSMPHRGIDYAAPSGTKVHAAGDGVVTIAGKTKPNGNYIVLRHGERYQTKYLHLSNFARGIRRGQNVSQGDVIGYVGATGWATGPHLHYEFLDRGVHKDPSTVDLPQAAPIDDGALPAFREATAPLFARLDEHKRDRTLALATR